MRDRTFVDTNVLFYSLDGRDEKKQAIARAKLRSLMTSRAGVLSSQVVLELASNLVRKLGLTPSETIGAVRRLESFECVSVTPAVVQNALALQLAHSLSI